MNYYSLSYLGMNKFVLYFSTIKKTRKNGREKLFLINGKFFLRILKNVLFFFILWSPFIVKVKFYTLQNILFNLLTNTV